MRKILSFCLSAIIALSSCAQSAPEKKMTRDEVNALLKPFYEKLQAIPDSPEGEAQVKDMTLAFVKENRNEAGVYVVRAILSQVMDTKSLIEYVDADEFLKNDPTIIDSKKAWMAKEETGEGAQMKDFEAVHDGKTTKLSDYVGKGKYVLVDFWASWCGPCKREIPNLIKVWEKYKGDKFEVLGVATWDKPEDTMKAIESLGIKYPQMLNAQKAGSDAYGIQGIPEIILFSPDGKILKRGLRGEALEKAVEEALAN